MVIKFNYDNNEIVKLDISESPKLTKTNNDGFFYDIELTNGNNTARFDQRFYTSET